MGRAWLGATKIELITRMRKQKFRELMIPLAILEREEERVSKRLQLELDWGSVHATWRCGGLFIMIEQYWSEFVLVNYTLNPRNFTYISPCILYFCILLGNLLNFRLSANTAIPSTFHLSNDQWRLQKILLMVSYALYIFFMGSIFF